MDNENSNFGTSNSFNDDENSYNRSQIEEVVLRREKRKKEADKWQREEIPTLVVSVTNYNKAVDIIEKLKSVGVESNITEGGINLSLESLDQLSASETVLQPMKLRIQVGITNAEKGRNKIKQMNTEKRRKSNYRSN